MGTLLLLRHAHAEPRSKNGLDADRPLSAAGRQEARQVGGFLRRAGLPVDEVLCSAALRARETAAAVIEAAQLMLPVQHEPVLYEAPAEEILAFLHGRGGRPGHVLLVGHNPVISDLAGLLTSQGRLALAFPPATLAAIGFEGGWQALGPGRGLLLCLVPAKTMG
jgi:phosphohistidine phosphatase